MKHDLFLKAAISAAILFSSSYGAGDEVAISLEAVQGAVAQSEKVTLESLFDEVRSANRKKETLSFKVFFTVKWPGGHFSVGHSDYGENLSDYGMEHEGVFYGLFTWPPQKKVVFGNSSDEDKKMRNWIDLPFPIRACNRYTGYAETEGWYSAYMAVQQGEEIGQSMNPIVKEAGKLSAEMSSKAYIFLTEKMNDEEALKKLKGIRKIWERRR